MREVKSPGHKKLMLISYFWLPHDHFHLLIPFEKLLNHTSLLPHCQVAVPISCIKIYDPNRAGPSSNQPGNTQITSHCEFISFAQKGSDRVEVWRLPVATTVSHNKSFVRLIFVGEPTGDSTLLFIAAL